MSYIARPSATLWAYLKATHKEDVWCERWYQYGSLSMALEVITVIKTLEELPVVSEVGRAETVSALQTLLVEQGLSDLAWEMYERLNEWRKLDVLKLDDGVLIEPEHEETVDVVPELPLLPLGRNVFVSSSDAFPRGLDFQIGSSRASLEERRGLGDGDEEPSEPGEETFSED